MEEELKKLSEFKEQIAEIFDKFIYRESPSIKINNPL